MVSANTRHTHHKRPCLKVRLVDSAHHLAQAQRLRYQVFTQEFGARLHSPVPGLDVDAFDAYCDHLIVEDTRTGSVVATTRLLGSEGAARMGGYYSESEFDLRAFHLQAGRVMEVGRTCVHPAFRHGATLSLLWSGIAACVLEQDYDHLIGCASIAIDDDGAQAWAITDQLRATHQHPALSVEPRQPLPRPATVPAIRDRSIPPLIRAYMRLGAKIGGAPGYDPDFGCADLFIILQVDALAARYARHFLRSKAVTA